MCPHPSHPRSQAATSGLWLHKPFLLAWLPQPWFLRFAAAEQFFFWKLSLTVPLPFKAKSGSSWAPATPCPSPSKYVSHYYKHRSACLPPVPTLKVSFLRAEAIFCSSMYLPRLEHRMCSVNRWIDDGWVGGWMNGWIEWWIHG